MSGRLLNRPSSESGAALLLVLAVLTLLALTISAIVIFGGWRRAAAVAVLNEVKAESLAEAGIQLALAESADSLLNYRFELNVDFDATSSVVVKCQPWGAYLRVSSTGVVLQVQRELRGIIGVTPPPFCHFAIWQATTPYPLVISGSTRIIGDVCLGPAGVTSGEIAGRGFEGDRLVVGGIFRDPNPHLATVDNLIITTYLEDIEGRRNLSHYSDLSLIVRSKDDLESLAGNVNRDVWTKASIVFDLAATESLVAPIVLFADQQITVAGNSRIADAVLCAPTITIKESASLENCITISDRIHVGGNGRVRAQIIVRDTAEIVDVASLHRPSLILLRGRVLDNRNSGAVLISSKAPLTANVFYGPDGGGRGIVDTIEATGRLRLSVGSSLSGVVWWEGFVDLQGRLEGSLAARLFAHTLEPTTYINWLVDADIVFDPKSASQALPWLFRGSPGPRVVSLCGGMKRAAG